MTPDLPVLSRDTVLTTAQCAKALGCSVQTLLAADLPCCFLGQRNRRYVWGEVVDALKRQTMPRATPLRVHRSKRGRAA